MPKTMHEMTLAVGLMNIIREEMRKHNTNELHSATVRCGALANVVPEALETAFDVLKAREDGMQNAHLYVISETLVLACGVCKRKFTPEHTSPYAPCPFCDHEFFHDIKSGREIILDQLQAS